ncbi:metallophosphoesterase [Spiribacter vilamensis]|uniref:Icc protein n=1 Tax=Spiribacter vilamensis TaxID=531306 RepID=A0A4Q8D2Y2_9GAMM|nr:metallophosphoesterase [Spiribacter vilamensis]RZU99687.1 Icc protein [Spiribacter vilamensis]TVO61363.1 phosphodiesterase [Spiribacter vilamensis]
MSVAPLNGPRLLQITDTHLYADPDAVHAGVVPERRFRAVLAALSPWLADAQAILHSGDLVHDGTLAAYQRLHSALGALERPGRVIPGNHDDREALGSVFASGPISAARTLVVGDWTLIGLDSLQPGRVTGALADDELVALDAALAAMTTPWCLIAVHHPPVPVGTPWLDALGLEQPEPLLQRIDADPRIRAVLSGHVHTASSARRHGCRMLTTPATAAQFLAGAERFTTDPGAPGFRWLDLRADGGIDTSVVRVPMD